MQYTPGNKNHLRRQDGLFFKNQQKDSERIHNHFLPEIIFEEVEKKG